MSDIGHWRYGRNRNYNTKFSPQHRRRVRSDSPPVRRYRNRMSRELNRPQRCHQSSRCIGVFGMSPNTTQDTMYDLFSKFGPIERIQMVNFTHTHISRGFCFIYFDNLYDACIAKDACSDMRVDGRYIRVDYAISQRAFTPTPGVYKGRPSRPRNSASRVRVREVSRKYENYSSSARLLYSSRQNKYRKSF